MDFDTEIISEPPVPEYYISVADAALYFAARVNTDAWELATDSGKFKAIGHAGRIIDMLSFKGSKTVSTQALEFPRDGDATVPVAIVQACCEIALALLDNRDPDKLLEATYNQSIGIGGALNITKDPTVVPDYIAAGVPSATAWRLLRPFMVDPYSVEIVRCS